MPNDKILVLASLDQYSLSGPRRWRNSPAGSTPTTRSNTPVPEKIDKEPVGPIASQIVPSSSPISPILVSPLSGGAPAVPPMVCALEALARLQCFHIEQGPDIMVPPPGWTLVAEKETSSVYKKIVPHVSDVFPVYRGDRVIEGVTAEEMVSALSAFSSRPLWDDRVETSSLLESYGHGCTTALLTTKPNFPFKGRLLQVAQVNAQMQIPSSSATSSTTTVHFIASASYSRSDDLRFSNAKLNPQGLVEGNVLLEGWIMETIDPYSVSFHAIPSTRCTYFSAIDYRGSVPVAFNSMLNSSLPKLISGVERLVKLHGPLPKVCCPVLSLRIDGPLGTEGMDAWEWRLKTGNLSTVAIAADAAVSKVFRATVLILKEANEPLSAASAPATITPSGLSSTNLNTRYDVVRQLRKIPPVTEGGKSTDVRRLVSNPDLRRKTSGGQVRRTGVGTIPNPLNPNASGCQPGDLVILEVALDRKLYPGGFQIFWTASFVKDETAAGLDVTDMVKPQIGPGLSEEACLPIDVSIHEMPSPAVFAASLDPGAKREHLLLRMSLPVGTIHSPIHDPLGTASETAEVKVPAWYNQLSKHNALINLSVEPVKEVDPQTDIDSLQPPTRQGAVPLKEVSVNGILTGIVPLLQSQTLLDRWEVDDYIITPCSISR